MKTQDVIDLALASGLYQDGDMFFSPTTGDADVHISDLEYFAKLVEERALSRQKAIYYQEGYEAGLDIKSKLMQDALYLLAAEREACAKLCDLFSRSSANVPSRYEFMGESAEECAALIRARGEK